MTCSGSNVRRRCSSGCSAWPPPSTRRSPLRRRCPPPPRKRRACSTMATRAATAHATPRASMRCLAPPRSAPTLTARPQSLRQSRRGRDLDDGPSVTDLLEVRPALVRCALFAASLPPRARSRTHRSRLRRRGTSSRPLICPRRPRRRPRRRGPPPRRSTRRRRRRCR